MVALGLNLPVKHAGLVPVRLPVTLGKLVNKTLTTDNWHRERGRSTEAKQLLQLVDLDPNPPNKNAGLVPVRRPVRLGKLINKTLTTHNRHREHGRSTEAKQKERTLPQLVDLDLNPPKKQAGLVPVRVGKFNKTLING